MTRECHVRFCERLGVRLPGATLPTGTPEFALIESERYANLMAGVWEVRISIKNLPTRLARLNR